MIGGLPWRRVTVRGPSMVPTLHDGDVVLVGRHAAVHPGDVVLGRFVALPHRLVVKRAARRVGARWWLHSDNPFADGDSEVHGPADLLGRVVAYWPRSASGGYRLIPRRLPAPPPAPLPAPPPATDP